MQICSQTLVSLKNWLQLITIQKTSTAFGKREVKVIKGEMRTPQTSRAQKRSSKVEKDLSVRMSLWKESSPHFGL